MTRGSDAKFKRSRKSGNNANASMSIFTQKAEAKKSKQAEKARQRSLNWTCPNCRQKNARETYPYECPNCKFVRKKRPDNPALDGTLFAD